MQQKEIKELLENNNFRNNQNYVLGKFETKIISNKIKNISFRKKINLESFILLKKKIFIKEEVYHFSNFFSSETFQKYPFFMWLIYYQIWFLISFFLSIFLILFLPDILAIIFWVMLFFYYIYNKNKFIKRFNEKAKFFTDIIERNEYDIWKLYTIKIKK